MPDDCLIYVLVAAIYSAFIVAFVTCLAYKALRWWSDPRYRP